MIVSVITIHELLRIVVAKIEVVLTRITKPEAQVRNRVVGLCAFQALDRFSQAIFLNAVIKALPDQLVVAYLQQVGQSVSSIHNGQRPAEAIEKEGSPRFVDDRFVGLTEFSRDVL